MYINALNEDFSLLLTHPQGIAHSKFEQNETLQQLSFGIKKKSKQLCLKIWCKSGLNKAHTFLASFLALYALA